MRVSLQLLVSLEMTPYDGENPWDMQQGNNTPREKADEMEVDAALRLHTQPREEIEAEKHLRAWNRPTLVSRPDHELDKVGVCSLTFLE
jgi:hypothetical protein